MSTVRIRLLINAIILNAMASDDFRTVASISGTVKIEITFDDVVKRIDIAVFAPTACILLAVFTLLTRSAPIFDVDTSTAGLQTAATANMDHVHKQKVW